MTTETIILAQASKRQLDWLMAKVQGLPLVHDPMGFAKSSPDSDEAGWWVWPDPFVSGGPKAMKIGRDYSPTTKPEQMWPTIDACPDMQFWKWGGAPEWRPGQLQCAAMPSKNGDTTRLQTWWGETKLVAAVRCYLASELGDDVAEVPKGLE
jgi:hypothetical protein